MRVIDWQMIVTKHGPAVWQTAYRLLGNEADAADCFQETFISALEASRRQQVRSFSAFLVCLATSRAIDRLRQRFRHSRLREDAVDLAAVPSGNPQPFQQAHARELAGRLRKALAQLPPQEAQVFCLRCLNNMSYRRIAKELGIKTNTAGVFLHRARTKLHAVLDTAAQEKSEV